MYLKLIYWAQKTHAAFKAHAYWEAITFQRNTITMVPHRQTQRSSDIESFCSESWDIWVHEIVVVFIKFIFQTTIKYGNILLQYI